MVTKIIIEGALLGALLILFCAVGIRNGAVNMVFLYHQDVQERCLKNGHFSKRKKTTKVAFSTMCENAL